MTSKHTKRGRRSRFRRHCLMAVVDDIQRQIPTAHPVTIMMMLCDQLERAR